MLNFHQKWKPELDINLQTNAEKLDDDHYQVVLTVSVTAKNDGESAFIAEGPKRAFSYCKTFLKTSWVKFWVRIARMYCSPIVKSSATS